MNSSGESGGKPELSCSCMGNLMTAVSSQECHEMRNRARMPDVFQKKADSFCFCCISFSFVSTHSHGTNQVEKACLWHGLHLSFHAFILEWRRQI